MPGNSAISVEYTSSGDTDNLHFLLRKIPGNQSPQCPAYSIPPPLERSSFCRWRWLPLVAEAYIGPGAGISFLQGLWVALVGVVLSVVAIILLPIRLLMRNVGATRSLLLLLGLAALAWFALEDTEHRRFRTRSVAGPSFWDSTVWIRSWPSAGCRKGSCPIFHGWPRVALTRHSRPRCRHNPRWPGRVLRPAPDRVSTVFSIFCDDRPTRTLPDFSISETQLQNTQSIFLASQIPTDGGDVAIAALVNRSGWRPKKSGLHAVVLRVPVTYPPDPIYHMLSGMGVPDLLGSQGTYSIFTTERRGGYRQSTHQPRATGSDGSR